MGIDIWLYVGIVAGILSVVVALAAYASVRRASPGDQTARRIAGWIKEGAATYLRMLYKTLLVVAAVLGIVLGIVFSGYEERPLHGLLTAAAFAFGALCSALAGWLGMSVAVEANVRTAVACKKSVGAGFAVAFKAGGGIYTKTADIAADLVGKVEVGIPEDDPRNPAVIADNVGDNVGDVAGMGADIFDSYVAASVAAMLLGSSFAGSIGAQYVVLPLVLCVLGIASAKIGLHFVKVGKSSKPGRALNFGTVFSCAIFVLFAAAFFAIVNTVAAAAHAPGLNWGALVATLAGLAMGVLMGFTTDFFTNDEYLPVRATARISSSGTGLTIIIGFSYALISVAPALLGIVAATLAAYFSAQAFGLPGIYGIGIAAVGMLSLTGIVVSNDAYGPIVDNAKGIAEMSGMPHEVVDRANLLDSAGNTAKAITKGFSIGAAALTVLAIFAAYSEVIRKYSGGASFLLNLQDPLVLSGTLLGCLVPPLFSALTMLAVTRNAFTMIVEIRRQFKAKPGILSGTEPPDYAACIGIASSGALRALALPALIAVILPLGVGFILGPGALGGFLGGSIFTGVVFALLMTNGGGLWDNAKKHIEAGNFGGPGSDAHKAAVVGDTVGDPFKDTAGPSLNTLITVMSLVASLFAPLVARYSLF